MMKRILASGVCALVLVACQDQLPTEPDVPQPSFDINDVHSGGAALNQHFAFRFPMRRLSQRPPAGEAFAGGLEPVMKICRWTGSACDSPESELTMSSGTPIQFDVAGHEVTVRRNGVVVLPGLEAYLALWDSRTLRPTRSEVAENEIYRLRVFLGATELGFVDAKVWRTVGQLLQIRRWNEANPTNTYFPLPLNSILPVPFWIGELAVEQAQSFALTGLPASVVSGAAASVTVMVRDAGGNVAAGYRGTVAFSSSDPDATLPPDYTFTAADAGSHTFADALSFKKAGTGITVRVTDVAEASMFAEAALDVLPAAAASLELSGLSNPFGAGTTGPLTVTAHDANGNVATSYTGTIAFTSTDPEASLPAEYTFTAADAGTHAFEAAVTLHTAGAVTVRAEDNADADIFGETSVTVGAVAAATLQVTGLNNPTVAGTANSITVTARDPSGNLASDYTGTIAFTSTDPLATLPPESYTFTAADAGTHVFANAVTLRTAGSVTVTATDEAFSSITGAQMVTVSPAAAATLLLGGVPDQTTAGVAYDLTVTAKDEFGNIASGYGGTVGLTSNDDAAVLPPAYAFQAGDAGVRSFPGGVTFKTAGDRALQATDASAPAITGSLATTVAPAAAAELRFTVQPSNALAGTAIAPPVVVTAYDPFENLASSFTGEVTVTIGTNPGTGVLSGTMQVAAVSGAATFDNLSINAAGTEYSLAASAAGPTAAISEPFDITAPVAVDVHWVNPAGGLWSVATNWSPSAVPSADQNVFIDLGGTYAVTLNVNATVRSLTLGAASGIQTLSAGANRILTLSTASTILSNGRLTLNNALLTGAGAVTSAGVTRLISSDVATPFTNQGTIVAEVNNSVTGTFSTEAGSLLQILGTSNLSSGFATFTVSSGFTNHGTIEMTGSAGGAPATLNVNSGALVNALGGAISVSAGTGGGGPRTLNAQLNNQGGLTVEHPLTIARSNVNHVNSGVIRLTTGNLALNQSGLTSPSFTNDGTVTVDAGRTWTITGGAFTQAAGATLNGGGAVTLIAVNPAAFGTAFTLSALSVNNSVVSFATNITTATLALSLNDSEVNGPGNLTNAAGRTLTISSTEINTALANLGTIISLRNNDVNAPFGTGANAVLRIEGTSNLSSGWAEFTTANGFLNHGRIELTGSATGALATLTVTSGALVNHVNARIDVLPGTGGGPRTIAALLHNEGTLAVAHPLTINRASADHLNSGTITLTAGNVTLSQSGSTPSFTNTGTITIPATRSWTTNNGSFTQASGGAARLDGGGAMILVGVNPAAFGTAFTLSALSLNNTTVSIASPMTTETLALTLNNATITGPATATLTNAAGRTLTLNGSDIGVPLVNAGTLVSLLSSNVTSGFTTQAGSLLRIQGTSNLSSGWATFNVPGGFTNHGAIELTNSAAGAPATLMVNTGTLVNASDGTIDILLGAGFAPGTRTLQAELNNQGTLTVMHPLLINQTNTHHANSGTMSVSGGNLSIFQGATSSFTNSGTIDVAVSRVFSVQLGSVTNQAAGSIQGLGTFDAGGSAPFSNAGSVTVANMRIGHSLTGTGTFAPTTADFHTNATTIPVGGGYSYTNVRVFSAASFAGSASIAGNLTILLSGNLSIGAHEIVVAGSIATQDGGLLTMQNVTGILTVGGNASFGGGSTNTRLTAGTLRVGGAFAQTVTAGAFAPTLNHLTVLNGSGAQTVSFANPGATTILSHFHRLEIANASAAGITLGSPVFATGELRTPAGSSVARTIGSSAGQTLQAGGLDAVGLVLDRTPLRVVNGEALTRFDDAVFRNMDPAATQFRLDRLSDVVTFNNIQLLTTPETGVYLHLVDTDLAAPLFTLTMQGTQPPGHGGKVIESVAGQLVGWPF